MEKGISSAIMKHIAIRLNEFGVDISPVLRENNVSFENPNFMIPKNTIGRIFTKMCEITGDERIGLKMGFNAPLATLGVVGQLYQSCSTFKQVFELMKKHVFHLDNINTYTYEIEGDRIIQQTFGDAELRELYPLAEKQIIEHNIGFSIRCKREYLGRDIKPIEIWSPYKKIGHTDLLETYFKCPVYFEREFLAVILPVEMLDWHVPSGMPEALVIYENYLKTIADSSKLFSNNVKNAIKKCINVGVPTLEIISKQLYISERTLQRNLKNENTCFQKILDEVRVELATLYLQNSQLSNVDISDKLGYNTVNSFNKFIKKQTGENPSEIRIGKNKNI